MNTFINLMRPLTRKKRCIKYGQNYRRLTTAPIINIDMKMPVCAKPSFIDSLVSLLRYERAMKLHETVDKKHKKMGPIYKDYIGPVTAIFVNSPDDYRKIFRLEGTMPKHFLPEAWMAYNALRQCPRGLLFMDGAEWLHYRRIMNRLLLVPNLASNIIMVSCQEAALSLSAEWARHVEHDEIIDGLERRLYRWSIDVMLATLLGSSWQNYKQNNINNKTEKLACTLHKIFELTAKLSLLPVQYAIKLRLPIWREFVRVADDVLTIVQQLVMDMTRLKGDGLLNLMLQEGIDKNDLSRIVTDLIIAAGDTSAYSTQWALLLLATNPEVQEKLAAKVNNLKPQEIIHDAYVKGVLKESLRLYPTAPFLTRILPEDCTIAGYAVAQGELIVMSLYTSGRDSKNFAEPNKFKPERWLRNDKGNYTDIFNSSASIPFALGARSCVGKKLAEAQIILTLAELTKNFRIECINATEIKMILHLIAVPSESIKLKLIPRKNI